MIRESVTTRGADETFLLGREIGSHLSGGEIVSLVGSLGAGKSVLCRGVGVALGVERWRGSPTFTLLNEYRTKPPLVHADLYRLTEAEVEDLGLEERVEAGAVLLVEWGDRAEAYLRSLPFTRFLDVTLTIVGSEERTIEVCEECAQQPALPGGAS